jgi:hypothetical protein
MYHVAAPGSSCWVFMGIHLAKIFIVLPKSSLFLLKILRFYQKHGYSVEYTEYTLVPPITHGLVIEFAWSTRDQIFGA